ncbi:MAG: hypothetical protein KKB70_10525 [Proteobacteria bacterium]|nr:hypothetical protein [Pseudomonadota bacterium]
MNDEITHESTGDCVGFAWSPCMRCRSRLGGDRHEWFYRVEGQVEQGEVCGDCLDEINGI